MSRGSRHAIPQHTKNQPQVFTSNLTHVKGGDGGASWGGGIYD
jgi:hypothetical protein